jgi:hypothetical protein
MNNLLSFSKLRNRVLLMLALFVVPSFLLLITNKVEASHIFACSPRSKSSWVQIGGQWRTAKGDMCAGQIPGGGSGHCVIQTYIDPAVAVNYVGWTNWQCDLVDSNDAVVNSHLVGGEVNWNSSSKQSGVTWSNAYSLGYYVQISG